MGPKDRLTCDEILSSEFVKISENFFNKNYMDTVIMTTPGDVSENENPDYKNIEYKKDDDKMVNVVEQETPESIRALFEISNSMEQDSHLVDSSPANAKRRKIDHGEEKNSNIPWINNSAPSSSQNQHNNGNQQNAKSSS